MGKPLWPADLKVAGLSLWVFRRAYPSADDYYDGNWLDVLVEVEASGAHVEAAGSLIRTDEIAQFAEQLAPLAQAMRGEAELTCMEALLYVKVSYRQSGHPPLVIELTPDLMTQSHRFVFDFPQGDLIKLLRDCRRLLEQFPVKGSVPKGPPEEAR